MENNTEILRWVIEVIIKGHREKTPDTNSGTVFVKQNKHSRNIWITQ